MLPTSDNQPSESTPLSTTPQAAPNDALVGGSYPGQNATTQGGSYKDPVEGIPVEKRYHQTQQPVAPDPKPF